MTSGTRRYRQQSEPDHSANSFRRWNWRRYRLGTLLWLGLTLSISVGCTGLLSTGSILGGRFSPSPDESEFVLVDRTGQPRPGDERVGTNPSGATPGAANPVGTIPGRVNPGAIPTSAPASPANNSTIGPTTATSHPSPLTTPLADAQDVEQHIDRRTQLNPTTATSALPTRHPPAPVVNSNTIGDIDLAGPTDSETNMPPEVASASTGRPTQRVENRDSQTPATGQSFRVQVVEEEPNVDERNELDQAQIASSQAMVNAIQQVTQQGIGRLANNRSNSDASPALANLLLDQVQDSISAGQVQQASMALQNLETPLDVPAFDLNSNRPVTTARDAARRVEVPNAVGPNVPTSSHASVGHGDAATVQIAWRPAIQEAIRSIEQSVSHATDPQEKQSLEIYLRLLQLISHDPEQAVRNIDSLPKNRQNFWREQIFALSQIIQAPEADQEKMFVNHSRQATKALAHLQNAVESLKNEATLQVRQVQFCQEIRSFGDYDLAHSTLVSAGDPLLIYCEVFNYSAQRSNDANGDHFQTSLVPSYMIVDSQQQVVSQKEFPAVRDRCRSRRQDFYLVLQVEVPDLAPGKYHLQVNVEDLSAGKIAPAAPLTFQIRAAR